MSQAVWGDKATEFFFSLTPDKILDAVEAALGVRSTGRHATLFSLENRVYEIELEDPASAYGPQVIAKFYRPGRWSQAQILEEHAFLHDLAEDEVPVVPPLILSDGSSLQCLKDAPIYVAVFPKRRGRSIEEMTEANLEQFGRLLARMHNVGARRPFQHRLSLTVDTFGRANLAFLLQSPMVPVQYREALRDRAERLWDIITPRFAGIVPVRTHGDCHRANVLALNDTYTLVDFDDAVMAPPVQDIWLLLSGRDRLAKQMLYVMLDGYESIRDFDWRSLGLIECLRALRMLHFSAWVAKRYEDPAFPKMFPDVAKDRYWFELVNDLGEQIEHINDAFWTAP